MLTLLLTFTLLASPPRLQGWHTERMRLCSGQVVRIRVPDNTAHNRRALAELWRWAKRMNRRR